MTFPVLSGGVDPAAPAYPVQRSVRFRSSNSARFTRTFGTPTTANTYTFSAWAKRGSLGAARGLFSTTNNSHFGFSSTDALVLQIASSAQITTAALFRDPAAWYHVMYVQNGASSATLYVNGISVGTSSSGSGNFNTAVIHGLGCQVPTAPASFFDGCMALVYFVDGQALTPASFGASSFATSVWQPIPYTGTFGNNGFFLLFSDNSDATATTIGKDSSGNGNNLTPSGISVTTGVTYDSLVDVPTITNPGQCNFPSINNISTVTTAVVAGGGLETTSVASQVLIGTMRMDTGAYYWEITFSASSSNQIVGVYKSSATAVTRTTGLTTTAIGVRFNANAGTLDYTTDGTTYTSIATGLTGGGYFPYAANTLGAKIIYVNFGQRPFSYAIPSGYTFLNAYSMPNTIQNPARSFATTAYTGTGASRTVSNTRSGNSFQPDMVWIKSRSAATDNVIYDSVRGATRQIITNSTAVQSTQTTGLTAFTSSGFSALQLSTINTNNATYYAFQWNAGNGTTSWNFDGSLSRTGTITSADPCVVSVSFGGFSPGQAVRFTTTGQLPSPITPGVTYYAGNITAGSPYPFNIYDTEANAIIGGATGRISTSGSSQSGTHTCVHASKVSVNKQTGVSIISYVGSGANTTVGHGLGAVVDCAIIKNLVSANSWPVYHKGIGNTNYMFLSGTTISTADSTYWNNTTPTSSVISLGTNSNLNNNGGNYIMYAFATVPGFSSFEGYTGDGSSNGLFLYTGFKPRFAIFKQASVARSWIMLNPAGQTHNVQGPYLFADTSASEGTATALMDFLSNGIKMRSNNPNTNANTGTYVYMAWAESPFKYGVGG